jgi:Fur family zinc uptake transcriptional regulator
VAHHVPFLICDECESATEICDERVAKLLSDQAKALGFHARAQTLEVHGKCKRCGAV